MLKKQKGDFGTAHFFFPVYSCMKFTIKLPHKRNTIFNTTIQKKPFSSTLLKKKPSKLKKRKEKAHHVGEGEQRQGGTQSRALQMDKLLYTKKPLKPPRRRKESAMYSLPEDWECREREIGHKGKERGVWFNIFYGFLFIFFKFFIPLFYIFQLQRLR